MHELLWPALNFLALIGMVSFYVRKPAKDFIEQRHLTLKQEVQGVRKSLKAAQDQADDLRAKMKSLDVEVAAIRDQGIQQAQALKLKTLSEAQRLSGVIVSDARNVADGLYGDLKMQLLREVGEKVTMRAEKMLQSRLTHDEKAKIRGDFSKSLGGIT